MQKPHHNVHLTPRFGAAHRANAILHVQRRAWERLGIALATPEIISLSERCARGDLGDLGLADRSGRFHVETTIRNHSVRVIYCPQLKIIVTFFQRPMGCKAVDKYLRKQVRP